MLSAKDSTADIPSSSTTSEKLYAHSQPLNLFTPQTELQKKLSKLHPKIINEKTSWQPQQPTWPAQIGREGKRAALNPDDVGNSNSKAITALLIKTKQKNNNKQANKQKKTV